jgi:hypothetical protein
MKNRRDRLFSAMFHGLAVVLLATAAPASAQAASEARGIVYLDRNENRARDRGEPGIAGVKVSNGRDVVKTDREGRYAISLPPESILFLSKPARYRVPLDEVNLPQFYYIHYPNGTPAIVSWRWPVIEPTGPLPAAIDFALLPGETNDKFNALAFADPQTADDEDLDMMRKDIVDPLVGNPHGALFGVVAGDVMNDNLSLYERHNRLMAMIGVPMWNVPGNHDLNYQSPNNDYATETFKSVFGPDYYSFDYGRVHVLALNNVDWRGSSAGYRGFLHPKQLEWIRNDLADVPRDRLILIVTHILLVTNALDENGERYAMGEDINTVNFAELLELLKPFKHVYGIAGHDTSNSWKVEVNHTHGWHGYPFTAHTLAEARGSGWSLGPRDDRGVRPATMADGNPNGYYVLSFDGTKIVPRFVPAHTPAGQRMRRCPRRPARSRHAAGGHEGGSQPLRWRRARSHHRLPRWGGAGSAHECVADRPVHGTRVQAVCRNFRRFRASRAVVAHLGIRPATARAGRAPAAIRSRRRVWPDRQRGLHVRGDAAANALISASVPRSGPTLALGRWSAPRGVHLSGSTTAFGR